jgi:flagellar hook-basal body complex protein FliE
MRIEALKLAPITGDKLIETSNNIKQPERTFGEFLSEALSNVNQLQNDAKQASLNLAAGRIQDISEVTIAAEKATVALQLTMQVRNKVVDAYQEVMRMQV